MNRPDPEYALDTGHPLVQAGLQLDRMRRLSARCRHLPLLAGILGGVSLVVLNVLMFHNIYLSLFLGVVFAGFLAGQLLALRQLRRLREEIENGRDTLRLLAEAGDAFDPADLRRRLRDEVPPGEIRNLVLGWVELGLQGAGEGHETLLEEALGRRSIRENRTLSVHETINSITLKLGFLGTLIGIILTFPPMKRAVLGLSGSDGELLFIRDIALAIDGDQYAILSTLIAIALSILIESITIQILERLFHGSGTALSHVNEWNALTLQPLFAARRDAAARAEAAEKNRARLEEAVAEAQAALDRRLAVLASAARSADERLGSLLDAQRAMEERARKLEQAGATQARLGKSLAEAQLELDRHLSSLAAASASARGQLDEVARLQLLMEERMARLAEYERQYRDFLSAKSRAVAPDAARGEA